MWSKVRPPVADDRSSSGLVWMASKTMSQCPFCTAVIAILNLSCNVPRKVTDEFDESDVFRSLRDNRLSDKVAWSRHEENSVIHIILRKLGGIE